MPSHKIGDMFFIHRWIWLLGIIGFIRLKGFIGLMGFIGFMGLMGFIINLINLINPINPFKLLLKEQAPRASEPTLEDFRIRTVQVSST